VSALSTLTQTLHATLDGRDVVVLNIDTAGALLEHGFRLQGDQPIFRFEWHGENGQLKSRAAESQLQGLLSDREQRMIYHTRIEFSGDTSALRRALAAHEARLEQAREANSSGLPQPDGEEIEDLGATLRARRIGYVSFVLRDGVWSRFDTMSPDQPLNGFTVAAHEEEGQLRLLRLAWEEADADGRKLLRQFAAESIRPDTPLGSDTGSPTPDGSEAGGR
jgi:hypothetical protein